MISAKRAYKRALKGELKTINYLIEMAIKDNEYELETIYLSNEAREILLKKGFSITKRTMGLLNQFISYTIRWDNQCEIN